MRTVNLTTKRLEDFEPGDTVYLAKKEVGFVMIRLCRFQKIARGLVHAVVLSRMDRHDRIEIGSVLKARKESCLLWGGVEGRHRCHWYDKELGWK